MAVRVLKKIKRTLAKTLPDYVYISLLYRKFYGCFPNLKNPRTFDEKVQWYKLYYRLPIMTRLADKYEVRSYLAENGFSDLLNDLYGVYESVDEIDLSTLPDRFVIKATHGSNMNLICKDKRTLDWAECRVTMKGWLRTSHYYSGREWAYKNIRPRLICEKYLENEAAGELIDYKFFCFSGKPEILFICTRRFSEEGVRYDAFDINWNRLPIGKGKPQSEAPVERPFNYDAMAGIARRLSSGFPFVRVDLYSVKERVVFGEFTFYPDSGLSPFTPKKFDYYFGDMFLLPGRNRV